MLRFLAVLRAALPMTAQSLIGVGCSRGEVTEHLHSINDPTAK